MKKSIIIPLLLATGAVISLSGLYTMEFMRIDARFALFVTEMQQSGIGWFPTLFGKPYTDYPSVPIILMYLASLGGTHLNMLTATLPNALAGLVVLLFTFLLGERARKNVGIYGAGLCLFAFEFLTLMRHPGSDLMVAAVTVVAVFTIYTALRGDGGKRLAWLPLLLLTGYICRGPLGFIIPTAAVLAVYLAFGCWWRSIGWLIGSGVLFMGSLVLTLVACRDAGGRELAQMFLNDQLFGRIEQGRPCWYYFTNAVGSFAPTYPLAIVTVIFYARGIFAKPQRGDSQDRVFLRMLTFWALLILVGMSVPGTKHLRYIAAAIPALGLLAAWIFANPNQLIAFELLRRLFFLIARFLPFFGLAAIVATGIVLNLLQID
ncbi:MAG: hypothetical protein PHQ27_00855, partial [Victivallales bacterium]|nr:hypothetical protein [Victivallales bacterium]